MEKEAGVKDEGLNDITIGDETQTDELLGYKPFNVNDYTNEVDIVKGEDDEEYAGDIGDRYRDAQNNDYTVRDEDNGEGDVVLQGQQGETDIAPDDIKYLERLSEAKDVLRNRSNKLTKKEAVQILIKHNIR
jgi:hypothetical protein